MPLLPSKRADSIIDSPTMAASKKATELIASGQDIIDLAMGEPDFDTPDSIKFAAQRAIRNGATKYTAIDGTAELKQAIIDKFDSQNGLQYQAQQILVSCGSKQSFFNLALAYLNPGDEVIIPAPYWVSYPHIVSTAEACPVFINSQAQRQFKITGKQLTAAITDKTRMVVLNSPSNPSGMAYAVDEWMELAKVLIQHPQILIVSDEIYEHIYWGTGRFQNILNVMPKLYPQTMILNGISKAYAMTGWRIGYAAGPEALIKAMKKIQSQSTSSPCAVSQAAATAALNGSMDEVQNMCIHYSRRHDRVYDLVNAIEGLSCQQNDGTFYAFINIALALKQKPELKNDVGFADFLLNRAGVAVVPGSAFGCPGHIRLSYTANISRLEDALARIAMVLA